MNALRSLLPILLTLGTAACASAEAEEAMGENSVALTANAGWEAYVAETTKVPLQDDCRPFARAPGAGTTYQGTALLLHGFSACPQQYEQLAEKLSQRGYRVLVPLMPGHGRVFDHDAEGRAIDDTSALPDDAHYTAYGSFAKRMAGIVAAEPEGTHVVVGLSVGGAVAASAAIQAPATFKRVLLMNAFFDIASPFAATLAPAANALVPQLPYGWGERCDAERDAGRAGFCNFKITNLRAVQHFGRTTLDSIAKIEVPVQVVGVEGDAAASNSAISKAASRVEGSACFFEQGVPHSLLSPEDNQGSSMPWLPAALAQITEFVTTGRSFNLAGASAIAPHPRCAVR